MANHAAAAVMRWWLKGVGSKSAPHHREPISIMISYNIRLHYDITHDSIYHSVYDISYDIHCRDLVSGAI